MPLVAGFYGTPASSMDAATVPVVAPSIGPREEARQSVSFKPEFFLQYQPLNAWNMVERLPGFTPEDGDASRGFGGAASNILINNRRPTAKQDTVADILRRIPVEHVLRIDMIRSGGNGIDMRGYGVLANVVLKQEVPAILSWELLARKNFQHGSLTPEGKLFLTDTWRQIGYTAGIFAKQFASGELGPELVYDGKAVISERRLDKANTKGVEIIGNLGAKAWMGDALLRLNTEIGCIDRERLQHSRRSPQVTGVQFHAVLFGRNEDQCHLEIGSDVELPLGSQVVGKTIVLYGYKDRPMIEWEQTLPVAGAPGAYISDRDRKLTERIVRFEFDWNGASNHSVGMDLELANNTLENHLIGTVETDGGNVVSPVPGANGRVEEIRTDLLLSDAWKLEDYSLVAGLGAEVSRLSQRGDVSTVRRFSYLKPSLVLTYSPDSLVQARLRLAREISQLNFEHFVSATNLQDNKLKPGNPDLRPETTWLAEVSLRRRFGSMGTVILTGFHNWISHVEDLLPVSPTLEVTGNLGDGRRWGAEIESTLPLDALGLESARLDFEARWQDSAVEDPVTGSSRVLSDERQYEFTTKYRQDFTPARAAWGFRLRIFAERPLFKVNELDIYGDGPELNVFLETTRWMGVKVRLTMDDLLNRPMIRDRRVFMGMRYRSPVAFREYRDRTFGRRLAVAVSGAF